MALVGDDAIEGVNRNVQLVRFVVVPLIVAFLERGLPTEKVDGHSLNRADIGKGMPGIRGGEVLVGSTFGSNGSALVSPSSSRSAWRNRWLYTS